jgi:hypothetical protein
MGVKYWTVEITKVRSSFFCDVTQYNGQLATEVSGQHIGSIFKGQAENAWNLKMIREVIINIRWEDLIYRWAQDWSHFTIVFSPNAYSFRPKKLVVHFFLICKNVCVFEHLLFLRFVYLKNKAIEIKERITTVKHNSILQSSQNITNVGCVYSSNTTIFIGRL